jgi:DNA ligase-1
MNTTPTLGEPREPMLSAKEPNIDTLLQALRWPKLASPKMDGVRAFVWNGKVYTRSLKLVPNNHVQAMLGHREFDGLDGELCVGNPNDFNVMQQTMSGVTTIQGKPNFRFYVFDDILHKGPFEARLRSAHARAEADISGYIKPVPHELVSSADEMFAYEERVVGLGFEGVMLRHPQGLYKHGRSTMTDQWLVAVKRFIDFEARIKAVKEGMTNTNDAMVNERGRTQRSSAKAGKVGRGTFGGFVCVTLPGTKGIDPGVEFEVGNGPGLTAALREWIWTHQDEVIGQIAKCSGQLVGTKRKPRLPKLRIKDMKFLGVRHSVDMS